MNQYFKGEKSLISAVVLNIIVITFVQMFVQYIISKNFQLNNINSISSIQEFWIVLGYYFLVLPFDYTVWKCASNAKRKVYGLFGRIFALKHIPFILLIIFKSLQ